MAEDNDFEKILEKFNIDRYTLSLVSWILKIGRIFDKIQQLTKSSSYRLIIVISCYVIFSYYLTSMVKSYNSYMHSFDKYQEMENNLKSLTQNNLTNKFIEDPLLFYGKMH
ncbi:hypothetical protein I4U23_024668 [Adineta vaga]|nr:hypothetical protein I4U23_024668 [Adineta vaga]